MEWEGARRTGPSSVRRRGPSSTPRSRWPRRSRVSGNARAGGAGTRRARASSWIVFFSAAVRSSEIKLFVFAGSSIAAVSRLSAIQPSARCTLLASPNPQPKGALYPRPESRRARRPEPARPARARRGPPLTADIQQRSQKYLRYRERHIPPFLGTRFTTND